jgi:hypothetical protein
MKLTFTFLAAFKPIEFIALMSIVHEAKWVATRELGREQDYFFEDVECAQIFLKDSIQAEMKQRFGLDKVIEA